MFKKQVRCRNCGFLGSGVAFEATSSIIECPQVGRDCIADGTHPNLSTLTCAKNIWIVSSLSSKTKTEALEILNSKRKCRGFFPYEAGYPPTEHKELQREDRNRRILLVGMLLAAVISAAIAMIAQAVLD